jgi:predicted PolB exonuclease-like 3'-5' exonuclease
MDSTEADLIQRFFSGIAKYVPTLVSWNGSQFDLPVLHYRALLHGVSAPAYWESGDQIASFKYNNYLSRYHHRHIDLMDMLAGFQQKAFARLEDIALMLGYPGKMGMGGSQVLEYYLDGDIASIRNYCETDVLNTYLIFLRFQYMRGILSPEQYKNELALLTSMLSNSTDHHLQSFHQIWRNSDKINS